MHQLVNPTWKLHHYYFDGACKPGGPGEGCHETFSVGIFRIEEKKNGNWKRGKVQIRIIGLCSQPAEVYSLAEKLCFRLNDPGPCRQTPKDFKKTYRV